jgi:hypothetical protein
MEQNAKQLLRRISEKVSNLTDKQISKVAHAPNYNEWRSYIWQNKPHWEDISWRVKEPNAKGNTEVHLGFYSSNPGDNFFEIIDKAEIIAKGKIAGVIKNENSIRLVWNVNLNNNEAIEQVFMQISTVLPEFLQLALSQLCHNNNIDQENEKSQIIIFENQNLKVEDTFKFPSKIPTEILNQIHDYYKNSDDKLAEYLKEVNDKFSFEYGGWIYSSSYSDIFEELEKVKINFPELFTSIESPIQNIENETSSEGEKWFKTIKLVSDELSNSGGKLVRTLAPNGGSDFSFLMFSSEKFLIPITLLYHFYETMNNASGWFDEYIEEYNVEYSSFLEKNNLSSSSDITHLEFNVNQGPFGISIESNITALNITKEIYSAALTGMMTAKQFC